MVGGLRIIGDMTLGTRFASQENEYYHNKVLAMVETNGFTITGSCYKDFGSGAFSLNIMLIESHVCIHTWPEKHFYSIDIHTCNFSRNNSKATRKMAKQIINLFDTNLSKSHLREISSNNL